MAALLTAVLTILMGSGMAGAEEAGKEPHVTVETGDDRWLYQSDTLTVNIRRFREEKRTKKKTRTLEYCVAEILASPDAPVQVIMSEPTKKRVAGYRLMSPELLLADHPAVFAMSDDLYGLRLQK